VRSVAAPRSGVSGPPAPAAAARLPTSGFDDLDSLLNEWSSGTSSSPSLSRAAVSTTSVVPSQPHGRKTPSVAPSRTASSQAQGCSATVDLDDIDALMASLGGPSASSGGGNATSAVRPAPSSAPASGC